MSAVEVAVVGGGQAGLAVSYQLTRRGMEHVVLEGGLRIGESWRRRWDSLRLFTPAQYDGLPGLPFPAPTGTFPSRDEMASYLESYVAKFSLPVRLGSQVSHLSRDGDGFQLDLGDETLVAEQVVIATGAYQTARVPAFAGELGSEIRQLHAYEYRNPQQLKPGAVLVVGAGNSGAEIAMEAAQAGHRTWLAGRGTGEIPPVMYAFDGRFFWFLANRVFSVATPIGRKMQAEAHHHGGPLIRLTMKQVMSAGVARVPRVTGARDGLPVLHDGQVLQAANVVWCTGFETDFSWIDLPAFDRAGMPEQRRGVVARVPGLYFVGLHFLTKLASAFVGGVGGDAKGVVEAITRYRPATVSVGGVDRSRGGVAIN